MIPPVPVLRYALVRDDPPTNLAPHTVTRSQLAAQLDALSALGCTALTVGELLLARASGMPLPERTVVLTFDGGSADFADHAWPALTARGLAATLYVTAGHLDGTRRWPAPDEAAERPMLSRRQVVELAEDGCEIGAHSLTDPHLDALSRSAAAREVARSKSVLERLVGRPVDSFAYPHGYADAGVRQLVVDAGFRSAVTIRNAPSPAGDDWFALARIRVTTEVDVEQLTRIVTAPSALLGRSERRWRGQLWRPVPRSSSRRLTDRRVGT